jgi:hypothetical protein
MPLQLVNLFADVIVWLVLAGSIDCLDEFFTSLPKAKCFFSVRVKLVSKCMLHDVNGRVLVGLHSLTYDQNRTKDVDCWHQSRHWGNVRYELCDASRPIEGMLSRGVAAGHGERRGVKLACSWALAELI